MRYDLTTVYDPRKSFYGKAVVEQIDNVSYLYSYGNKIAKIEVTPENKVNAYIFDLKNAYEESLTFSKTSLRHLKEYLKQAGLKAGSKKQILQDYLIVEVYKYDRI